MSGNNTSKIFIPNIQVVGRERTFELTQEAKDFWNLYRKKCDSVVETTIDVQKNPDGIEYILTRCDYKRADGITGWTNWTIREDGNLIFTTREKDTARLIFDVKVKTKVKV